MDASRNHHSLRHCSHSHQSFKPHGTSASGFVIPGGHLLEATPCQEGSLMTHPSRNERKVPDYLPDFEVTEPKTSRYAGAPKLLSDADLLKAAGNPQGHLPEQSHVEAEESSTATTGCVDNPTANPVIGISTQHSETPHELRPSDPEAAKVWDIAAHVPDPEIPVISIADLGILRAVRIEEVPIVTITPTYSGCPAMEHITDDLRRSLRDAGYPEAEVELVLNPAWNTDWITPHGREVLREYGIAPPSGSSAVADAGPIPLTLGLRPPVAEVACPRCGSTETQELSHFGSTSCKALYRCNACLEPFDYFKVH